MSKDGGPSVRLSVICLSHDGILSKRLNISSFFSSSRSHTILLFHTKHYDNMPTGPPNWGVEYMRFEKIAIFDQYRFISDVILDTP